MKRLIIYLFLVNSYSSIAAQSISGKVLEYTLGKKQALPDAVISWIDSDISATTNKEGYFQLAASNIKDRRISVDLLGYQPDTLRITDTLVEIILRKNTLLKTIEIPTEQSGTMISMQHLKTEIITSKELKKAACCNLGESFETNATVDITVKDAVFGSKEIQVLGLAGAYTQLLTENTPLINGLGLTYGLNYIPGSQINTINIVKGPGSVIFGPESMSGLIDVELKDPANSDKWFVNGYLDWFRRKELNIDKAWKLNRKLSTFVSTHADQQGFLLDRNRDQFADMPFLSTLSILNKWKYNYKALFSQNSVKYLYEERAAGQMFYHFDQNYADLFAYGQKLTTNRAELYGRIGYILPTTSYQSIGILYSFVNHEQNGFYGVKRYKGSDRGVYIRALFNSEWARFQSLNLGFSLKSQLITEQYDTLGIIKNEWMPGFFAENTYQFKTKLALITGIRIDQLQGALYVSPRANFKYNITEYSTLRASIGSGMRTANILAENPALLSSNRKILIIGTLAPEQSINYGLNYLHEFKIDYRKASFGVDIYRTEFSNKIIPDYESDFQAAIFQNSTGPAYANNLQLDMSWKVLKPLEFRFSYKYLDVKNTLNGNTLEQLYTSKSRTLTTLYYESLKKKWTLNFVWQWFGQKRLPTLDPFHTAHENKVFTDYSIPYSVFNTQVTKRWKHWEVYMGVDNIFDFRQLTHILSADAPYSKYFDSSYVWGPLEGRKVYTGFRYSVH